MPYPVTPAAPFDRGQFEGIGDVHNRNGPSRENILERMREFPGGRHSRSRLDGSRLPGNLSGDER